MIDDYYIENTNKIDSNVIDFEEFQDLLQSGVQKSENLQEAWVGALTAEFDKIAGIDPRPPGTHLRPESKRDHYPHVNLGECCLKPECHHK